jgi:hypothetical protein
LVIVVPMLTVWSQLNQRRRNRKGPMLWTVSRIASTALVTVPYTIAGSSPASGAGGLYWLARTALLGIVGAIYDAWVLLVEIVR